MAATFMLPVWLAVATLPPSAPLFTVCVTVRLFVSPVWFSVAVLLNNPPTGDVWLTSIALPDPSCEAKPVTPIGGDIRLLNARGIVTGCGYQRPQLPLLHISRITGAGHGLLHRCAIAIGKLLHLRLIARASILIDESLIVYHINLCARRFGIVPLKNLGHVIFCPLTLICYRQIVGTLLRCCAKVTLRTGVVLTDAGMIAIARLRNSSPVPRVGRHINRRTAAPGHRSPLPLLCDTIDELEPGPVGPFF